MTVDDNLALLSALLTCNLPTGSRILDTGSLDYPVPFQATQGLARSKGHRLFAVSVPVPTRANPNDPQQSVGPDLPVYAVVRAAVDWLLMSGLMRAHRLAAVLQTLLVLVVAAAAAVAVERDVADLLESAAASVRLWQSHRLLGWYEDSNSRASMDSVSNQKLVVCRLPGASGFAILRLAAVVPDNH